jgi:hypothetical protein
MESTTTGNVEGLDLRVDIRNLLTPDYHARKSRESFAAHGW